MKWGKERALELYNLCPKENFFKSAKRVAVWKCAYRSAGLVSEESLFSGVVGTAYQRPGEDVGKAHLQT